MRSATKRPLRAASLMLLIATCGPALLPAQARISPSRFPDRLGVMLSPEEDMDEGFFHPIKAQRGSGSGFYRDAWVFISLDFRISGRAAGAVARLRADCNLVRIQPSSGSGVLRQNVVDTWEPLPPQEVTMRFGVLYCNQMRTVFFELRNR